MKKVQYITGWVIVIAASASMPSAGIRYSFGVFFKSLSSDFMLNRAGISGISGLYWVCAASLPSRRVSPQPGTA